MAAYAALVSLEHIIDNLRLHCRPPIVLNKEQVHLLTQKLTFLQEFLQLYNPNLDYTKEADSMETHIARAAYAAEDAIESHIANQYADDGEKMSSDGLYEDLQKVIEYMALIEKEAMDIKESVAFQNQLHAKSTTSADSSGSTSSSSIAQNKSRMVGADDLLLEMKSRLTADARDLQTIPIVGMGGSGKTTLALNIYEDALIKEHFDIRAWVTFSQEYSIREILIQFLTQLVKKFDQKLSEGELGEMLHKHLYGRKYMVILDDMWSLKAWDGVKRFLPNNNNGSRIVITTRLTTLASSLPNSSSLGMRLLDENDSWDLLSKTVFGEKGCPPELEDIGKKIGNSCKGLPLLIVVVGGLLAKSVESIESWKHIDENLKAIVNLEDDERCLKTLYMSYKQLPVHLKSCFLYMGIYREDHVIRISKLVKLWVTEGFLKPISGKRPEDVARACIKDLTDRNLILIHRLGSNGSIKYCKLHDLLRDLCLREAKKEGFYDVYQGQGVGDESSRLLMCCSVPDIEGVVEALSSAPLARSLVLDLDDQYQPPYVFKLLRIFGSRMESEKFLDNVHQLVNSRSLNFLSTGTSFPNLIWRFWNLQTLIMTSYAIKNKITLPTEFWYMSHIRHLYMDFGGIYLLDPPLNVQADGIVMENLQSLGVVYNFKCSEQVVKTIPNIRKLRLIYDYKEGDVDDDEFRLTNLDCLDKLESLHCTFYMLMWRMNFPRSLRKLAIKVRSSHFWEDLLDKIGDLPLLEKLKLTEGSFKEGQWETSEGQFRRLKFLSLRQCKGLKVWTSEASHFPRLEQLRLFLVSDALEEIPSDFADISTLRLIDLDGCGDSAVESAYRILEEQEELYGEEETTLQVQVQLYRTNNRELVKSFKSPNFHFTWGS